MPSMQYALTVAELKARGDVSSLRDEYVRIAEAYNSLLDKDILMCPVCGDFKKRDTGFYKDNRYITGRNPICKECLLKMAEQRKRDKDEPNETKESVQEVLRILDRPYDNEFYEQCVKGAKDGVKEKNRHSPFATYITSIMSLPQWQDKTFKDSDFGNSVEFSELSEEELLENEELIKKGRNRFGKEYNSADLLYLEREYEDWTTRNPCETKAQEQIYQGICFKQLEIDKLNKMGRDTKEAYKTLQELMASGDIKPSQNNNTLTDAKTFGQLIEKWENEKPVPEPSEEFKDVDKIGQLVDVFFKGHLAKMMGIKNAFSASYENFIKKYTVTKPEYEDEEYSEELFEKMFGKIDE